MGAESTATASKCKFFFPLIKIFKLRQQLCCLSFFPVGFYEEKDCNPLERHKTNTWRTICLMTAYSQSSSEGGWSSTCVWWSCARPGSVCRACTGSISFQGAKRIRIQWVAPYLQVHGERCEKRRAFILILRTVHIYIFLFFFCWSVVVLEGFFVLRPRWTT